MCDDDEDVGLVTGIRERNWRMRLGSDVGLGKKDVTSRSRPDAILFMSSFIIGLSFRRAKERVSTPCGVETLSLRLQG
jgi:hypothetical protein